MVRGTKMKKTVLVTGVAGFIGRYVTRYFADQGWQVVGVDNHPPENVALANLTAYHRCHLPSTEFPSILQTAQPQVCIHCAGRASVGLSITDPSADFYASTAVTFEVLNALRLYAPSCRFLFLSSAAVYGSPTVLPISEEVSPYPISPYGFHKWQGEQLCQEFTQVYGVPTASVRIFSAYGPGLRRQVLWDICQKALTQSHLALQGTGEESRDFIHALDIAQALYLLATIAPMHGEVYNLGTGSELTIAHLTNLLLKTLGCGKIPDFDGIIPLGTPKNWRADISKLQALGFEAKVPIEKGIETFAHWCRAELVGV
jgi:UDP-glucose 4-epimerase